jgi:hypothetical protein
MGMTFDLRAAARAVLIEVMTPRLHPFELGKGAPRAI